MKKVTSQLLKTIFLIALLGVFGAAAANAQSSDPPDDLGPTPTPPATAIPIDGGASLLIAGGVAYGLKKLRENRRRK